MEKNTLPLELPTGTGTHQRVENENSSDNQGRYNSSNISGPEREDDYAPLLNLVRRGDWNATRDFLHLHPAALTARITSKFMGGTVLHAAVDAEYEHIVEELVNMISEDDLAIQDYAGFTALHETTISGNLRIAKCLITKTKNLVSIINNERELPVTLAMANGHKELARYLYSQTPLQDLEADQGCHGATLLNRCFYNRDFDMALDLMERCPRLAFALDLRRGMSPLEVFANISTDALGLSGNYGMVFWKQWIYSHCIQISLARAADQFRLNIQNGQENNIGSVRADLWRQLYSTLWNLLGFKRLYEMKLVRAQFQRLLLCMCYGAVTTVNTEDVSRNRYTDIIRTAIFSAIRRGNYEFVYLMVKRDSGLFWISDVAERRSIFHWAVLHRQHRIFSLIYGLKKKNALLNATDTSRNTILHMAGKLTENTPIDHIRGAALQMQREVQWFKEVELICGPLSLNEILNEDGLTARQLFMKDHQEMRKEGERWMKDTSTSCTVVGALIITIMFAAAFTIPGVLIFLGIHTSRYAEEDFLRSLPRKMIIGFFALFFSIATMMIAFATALLLMLRGKYWSVVPIIGLAGVPIILFVSMQFRLLISMFVSTYGSSICDWKMKLWL